MAAYQSKSKISRFGKISSGIVHITTTFNNIIISVTDQSGDLLASSSAGKSGFKGAKKSTPFAAQVTMENLIKIIKDSYSIKTVMVVMRGPGAGKESAVRAIFSSGMIITIIKDITPLPHNGCRKPKRRRV